MSFSLKKLAQFQATTSETTFYTVPTGNTTTLKQLLITNTSASAATLSVSLVPSGGAVADSNRIMKNESIPANDTVVFDLTTVMAAGDFLSSSASVASAITVYVSGLESPGTNGLSTGTGGVTSSTPQGTPSGGYAQVTATQSNIGASATDLTGLTVTVTLSAGRRFRITGYTRPACQNSATDVQLQINEGATTLNFGETQIATAGNGATLRAEAIITPTAGSHTYKLTILFGSGTTNTMNASATNPAFIHIEDVGI